MRREYIPTMPELSLWYAAAYEIDPNGPTTLKIAEKIREETKRIIEAKKETS